VHVDDGAVVLGDLHLPGGVAVVVTVDLLGGTATRLGDGRLACPFGVGVGHGRLVVVALRDAGDGGAGAHAQDQDAGAHAGDHLAGSGDLHRLAPSQPTGAAADRRTVRCGP
jgi:hypothetical protein